MMTKRERVEIAMHSHKKGNNCGQSVLLAFQDLTGLTEEQCLGIATGFGGGMRCGSICGALSGAIAVLGTQYPATDGVSKKRSVGLTKGMVDRFRDQFGYLNCRELLAVKDIHGTPIAEELMHGDHCGTMIGTAVELLCDYLDELKEA
ncbi:MAG: C_GCAxxG_C_C family protein [Clostridiales bacterium]|nr:C_GCAxxG_C_C family protein [Candidatus Cacconaster stercorequi]